MYERHNSTYPSPLLQAPFPPREGFQVAGQWRGPEGMDYGGPMWQNTVLQPQTVLTTSARGKQFTLLIHSFNCHHSHTPATPHHPPSRWQLQNMGSTTFCSLPRGPTMHSGAPGHQGVIFYDGTSFKQVIHTNYWLPMSQSCDEQANNIASWEGAKTLIVDFQRFGWKTPAS